MRLKLYRIPNQFSARITLQASPEAWEAIVGLLSQRGMKGRVLGREVQAQVAAQPTRDPLVPVTLNAEDAQLVLELANISG